MNPSSAIALVSSMPGAAMSAFLSVCSAAEMGSPFFSQAVSSVLTSTTARRFRLCVVFIVRYSMWLSGWVILLHLLQLRRGPLAFRRFHLRPVEAHVHDERPFRRGQPVGFLFFAGGFVLEVERQPAVGVALQVR